MSETWDEHAGEWDSNPDVRAYADKAFASLLTVADLTGKGRRYERMLDFGCGTGLLSERLAPHVDEIVAIDTSPKMIAVLRSKDIGNVKALCADIDAPETRKLPEFKQPFDMIVASSALTFVPDYDATVRNLAGHLRGGGLLVQWDWLKTEGADDFGLTPQQISNAFETAGLDVISVGDGFRMDAGGQELVALMGAARRPSQQR